ncbi:MAG: hypothetical protein JST12_10200 [Armatimonadetes bacterium]|nr:hypothetical protein [Armatimonadota bacterium]MBS1728138.1 hypothetical protein [Armatimonadota bacterium]
MILVGMVIMIFETNRLFDRLSRLEYTEEAFSIYGDIKVNRYLGREPNMVESLDAVREILGVGSKLRRIEAGAWRLGGRPKRKRTSYWVHFLQRVS